VQSPSAPSDIKRESPDLSYTFNHVWPLPTRPEEGDSRRGLRCGGDLDWAPRYNVAPSQDVPVIGQDVALPVRSLSLMRWGLIPFWAKDPKVGFNAESVRSRTLISKSEHFLPFLQLASIR
jgi:putative SOS response-associated peptidase YedK